MSRVVQPLGDTVAADSKSPDSQAIVLSLPPNCKVEGGLAYHRIKLALTPLRLRPFSKNVSEEVRMQGLSSHVGVVGGARALNSRQGRESCGRAANQEALI